MLRELLQFITGQIALQTYWCDRCQQVELHSNKVGLIGYFTRTKNGYHYCKSCWNWMRIMKGECPKCGNKVSNRSTKPKVFKTCESCCISFELRR